jgi:hypothetical protein
MVGPAAKEGHVHMKVSRTVLSIITGLAVTLIRGVPRRVLVAVALIGALAVPAAAQARGVGTAASASPLQAVTCTSDQNCWAVGGAYQTGAGFIEHWNGSTWQVVPSQNPPKSSSSVLDGVSCAQANDCWAVGYYVNARGSATPPYAEHWNGQAWSELALPYPAHEVVKANLLGAVSCPATNLCFADGSWLKPVGGGLQRYFSLIERWNGSTWQIVPTPVLPHSTENGLEGLSCASARDCWATGSWLKENIRGGALGLHWNGHQWAVARITNDPAPHTGSMLAASCPTTQMCMGIGQKAYGTEPGLGLRMFAQQWNGSSWAIAPLGTGNGNNLFVYAVSCATAQTCMAVGERFTRTTVSPTLVEQWNGSSWATVPSPNPPGPGIGKLYGVSCPQVTACWAVGTWESSIDQVLIEHWNGTAWTIESS